MISIERTAYPRFKRYYTAKELKDIYTPTPTEKTFALGRTTGKNNYLNVIVLLKSFQRLGYFPDLEQVPITIVSHIKDILNLSTEVKIGYQHQRTNYRHRSLIRDYLQIQAFNKKALVKMRDTISQSAYIMEYPADLINVAIEELVKERYELPGFYTLQREVARIREAINSQIYQEVFQQLSPELRVRLNELLETHPVEKRSQFNRIKELPSRPSRNHLNDLLAHYYWLQSLGNFTTYLKHISQPKLKHFAASAKVLDASALKEMSVAKRLTLLVCLISWCQGESSDNLVEMFLKRIGKIHQKAKDELERLRKLHQETTEKLVGVFTNVLQVLAEDEVETEQLLREQVDNLTLNQSLNNQTPTDSNQLRNQINQILTPLGGIEQLLNECEAVNAYQGNNYLPLLWRFYKSHRSAFFRFLNALDFQSTTNDTRLIECLNFLWNNHHRRGEWLKAELDLSFLSQQWQKLIVLEQEQEGKIKIARRHFEVAIFSYLADELKSGDIFVASSFNYNDWREQLLLWSECENLIGEYCENLGLAEDGDSWIFHLQEWLTNTAKKVDDFYPQQSQLIISDTGEPVLKKPAQNKNSASLKILESIIAERMPERNLIEILRNVDYWTNFTRHFGPLSGSDPKLEHPTERYLLTVFTYGCNLGPTQAARHMRAIVTSRLLYFVNRRHITIDNLNDALVDIINRYHVLDLPTFWGKGKSVAADGTKYDVYEQNLLSEYHIRYGGYGGIAYHHVADKYIALFSHFIPCGTWEAVYIIDGLLQNKSDLQPDTIHGDTQAQSTTVFALCYLLGIKLMPRIRNWQSLFFYRPNKGVKYRHIDSLFKDTINWELIRTHWQDLFQVVLSIYTGKISSAMVLRKLGNYSRKNRLYQAFRELGRVVRTVFLLEYISEDNLRKEITAATNKVEAYHGFSKWFFFGGDSTINTNDPEKMEKIIKYNHLVANAVIFQNVVDLTEILQQLKREGYLLVHDDVAALSPYLTAHIKRFGDYFVDLEQVPDALDERVVLNL